MKNLRTLKVRKVRSDIGKKRGTYTGEMHQPKTNDLVQSKVIADYEKIEIVRVMGRNFKKVVNGSDIRFEEIK